MNSFCFNLFITFSYTKYCMKIKKNFEYYGYKLKIYQRIKILFNFLILNKKIFFKWIIKNKLK